MKTEIIRSGAAMKLAFLLLGIVVFFAASLAGCSTPDPPPTFEILASKEDVRIVSELSKGQVVFNVHSESGIGGAEVKLSSGQWPDRILVRLHLSGLESFKFSYPQTVIEVSIPSSGGRKVIRSVKQEGEDSQSAEEATPFFMPVVSEDQEGWFEVQTPADFHKLKPDGFRIEWIDFFR